MRNFIIFIILIVATFVFWVLSFPRSFNRDTYMNEETLAKSYPISVKIDVDLIKSLGSAYE